MYNKLLNDHMDMNHLKKKFICVIHNPWQRYPLNFRSTSEPKHPSIVVPSGTRARANETGRVETMNTMDTGTINNLIRQLRHKCLVCNYTTRRNW